MLSNLSNLTFSPLAEHIHVRYIIEGTNTIHTVIVATDVTCIGFLNIISEELGEGKHVVCAGNLSLPGDDEVVLDFDPNTPFTICRV
jgi:hypothetical protein